MTQTPPPPQGQIESPNTIELFWEKHRRWVIAGVAVAVLAAGANYAIAYSEQREVDRVWSGFLAAANFDQGYAEDGSSAWLLQNLQRPDRRPGELVWMARSYLGQTRMELVTELQQDLLDADEERLARARASTKGTAAEPLVMWLSAVRSVLEEEWDQATSQLDDLEQRFPEHFLCWATAHPPQYRSEIEEQPEPAPPDKDQGKIGREEETPELEAPVRGSPVSLLRDRIEREHEFRRSHARFYVPPEPDPSLEVVVKLAPIDEEIRIRLYPDHAPEHVDRFLELVRGEEKFYQGQRIDEVRRQERGALPGTPVVQQFHFGLEVSKEDARPRWTEARATPSGHQLEFEENDLSHFPGMVAADAEADGKSSGERIWITATDAAEFDGERVIFGRVVAEDLDIVKRICEMSFADEDMERAGQGQLQQNVTIESIRIVGS